jgi:hypothetical protein
VSGERKISLALYVSSCTVYSLFERRYIVLVHADLADDTRTYVIRANALADLIQ